MFSRTITFSRKLPPLDGIKMLASLKAHLQADSCCAVQLLCYVDLSTGTNWVIITVRVKIRLGFRVKIRVSV